MVLCLDRISATFPSSCSFSIFVKGRHVCVCVCVCVCVRVCVEPCDTRVVLRTHFCVQWKHKVLSPGRLDQNLFLQYRADEKLSEEKTPVCLFFPPRQM